MKEIDFFFYVCFFLKKKPFENIIFGKEKGFLKTNLLFFWSFGFLKKIDYYKKKIKQILFCLKISFGQNFFYKNRFFGGGVLKEVLKTNSMLFFKS